MSKIPHCTGCGEYPGDLVSDHVEKLEQRVASLEVKLANAEGAAIDAGAHLAAAIYLLEKGGKKAAPSNKMFDQMIADYKNSLERTRATLAELKGETNE